ncbi:YqaJ viral recombinase family protein [Tsukamurella sp. NPDC003166]|uniref:YqaJ viral recombinase family protein n=1 Tax=Tsukamurella sp. NPDC003166 TaxID=3154444 RepID=UPI0033B54DA7
MTATLLPEPLEPGSPEWLANISASKVAAFLGLSKWDTPHSMHHAMAGTTPPEKETQVQSDGTFWEPSIREWFAAAHPEWEVRETSTWRNDERPWQTADPDGLIYPADADLNASALAGVEIKCVHDYLGSAGWGKAGTDQVPPYYRVQAVWQMDTLGLDRVVFAVCGFRELMERKPAEYVVEYDANEATELRARMNAARMALKLGREPRADYAREEDRRVLKWKFPEVSSAGLDIPDEIAIPWLEALLAFDQAEAAEQRARGQLVEFMGGAKAAQWGGALLGTRRRTTPPSFSKAKGLDPAALLTDHRSTDQEAA